MPKTHRLLTTLEELWVACFAWIPTVLGVGIRLVAYKPLFAHCGNARFGCGLTLTGCRNMHLADNVRIGKGCMLTAQEGSLRMGAYTALSPHVHIGADNGSVSIGKYVAVGPYTVIRAANHRHDRVDIPIMQQGHEPGEIIIENDVWIAANCTITPNVRIGHGAIVGAGAVVTRDVEPLSIVAGVPARVIGTRASCTNQQDVL